MTKSNGYYVSGKSLQRTKKLYDSACGLVSDKVNCLLYESDGAVLTGTDCGLCRIKKGAVSTLFPEKLNVGIKCLFNISTGETAIGAENRLYFMKGKKLTLVRSFDSPLVGITEWGGIMWILTASHIIRTDLKAEKDSLVRPLEGGEGRSIAVMGDNIYAATDTNISIIHGKRMEWKNLTPRFCPMPDERVNSLCFDSEGYLWLGTDGGAAIHDNSDLWLKCGTLRTLPQNPIYKIVTDSVGGRYYASDVGVIYQKNGGTKYFSATRWVPDNKINDIAVSPDGAVFYAATDKGVAEITSCEMSLLEKAQEFEKIIEKYHVRRGFVAERRVFNFNMDDGEVHISDNDGLWTGCNVAAESFRYAATGEKEALEKARRGMKAMLFLTRVSGIPGFTARAVRYPGEEGFGNGDHEWALSPDGECEWKGETSSDEMTGHFFGLSIYYDLCANKSEKAEISKALCGIMEHILKNKYRLVDRDGLPTTWACWDPELLNHADKWFPEKGINSLELLAFLKVCAHISGDEKYAALYNEFITRHHYHLNAMQHKIRDAHLVHIDDNLAFLASLTLLRLEENESIRAVLLCGMEDHWQYERIEKQPLFSFIHAIFTGRDEDLVEGVQSLREIPLDLIHYTMENSKRRDIVYDTEQEEWMEAPQVKYPLPYDERNLHRPDAGVFELDSGNRKAAQEGTLYLLPYWIARYYGILREE